MQLAPQFIHRFYQPDENVRETAPYSTCSVAYFQPGSFYGTLRKNNSLWLVPGTHHEAGVTFIEGE